MKQRRELSNFGQGVLAKNRGLGEWTQREIAFVCFLHMNKHQPPPARYYLIPNVFYKNKRGGRALGVMCGVAMSK